MINPFCPACHGEGGYAQDSGGVQPWGESIDIWMPCEECNFRDAEKKKMTEIVKEKLIAYAIRCDLTSQDVVYISELIEENERLQADGIIRDAKQLLVDAQEEIKRLRKLNEDLAVRVAAQSELLAQRAEKKPFRNVEDAQLIAYRQWFNGGWRYVKKPLYVRVGGGKVVRADFDNPPLSDAVMFNGIDVYDATFERIEKLVIGKIRNARHEGDALLADIEVLT